MAADRPAVNLRLAKPNLAPPARSRPAISEHDQKPDASARAVQRTSAANASVSGYVRRACSTTAPAPLACRSPCGIHQWDPAPFFPFLGFASFSALRSAALVSSRLRIPRRTHDSKS